MKQQKLVDVYRPAAPTTRTATPKDIQIARVFRSEADLLVREGFAEWRGRKHKAVMTTISTKALLLFVGQMRFKDRPEASGIDSRTHSSHGNTNPWKQAKHVRNWAYSDPIATRLNLLYVEGSHSAFTPRRIQQVNVERTTANVPVQRAIAHAD